MQLKFPAEIIGSTIEPDMVCWSRKTVSWEKMMEESFGDINHSCANNRKLRFFRFNMATHLEIRLIYPSRYQFYPESKFENFQGRGSSINNAGTEA